MNSNEWADLFPSNRHGFISQFKQSLLKTKHVYLFLFFSHQVFYKYIHRCAILEGNYDNIRKELSTKGVGLIIVEIWQLYCHHHDSNNINYFWIILSWNEKWQHLKKDNNYFPCQIRTLIKKK